MASYEKRLDEQCATLVAKLASLPGFELATSGTIPDSILNRFTIRHIASGKEIELHSFEALDFSMPKFEFILESFVENCRIDR